MDPLELKVKIKPSGKTDSLTTFLCELDDFLTDMVANGELEGYTITILSLNAVIAEIKAHKGDEPPCVNQDS